MIQVITYHKSFLTFTWALMANRGFSGEVLVKTGTLRTLEQFFTRLVRSASRLVVLCGVKTFQFGTMFDVLIYLGEILTIF